MRHDEVLRERRRDPAHQIEDQELDRPELVLDVVAEDPQIEHVAAEMQPAAVHEHGGEDGGHVAGWVLAEPGRNERPLANEGIAAVQLDEEEENVERDQRDR